MSLLSAHHLSKAYGTHRVLDDVSLTLVASERVGLVGDNGSGKTTLARILAGVEAADSGQRMLQRDTRVGYLPQVPLLEPNLTALDTALLGLEAWGRTRRAYEEVTAEIAVHPSPSLLERQAELANQFEHLGGWEQEHKARALLQHLCVPDVDSRVGSLSGGEQRRVSLAQLLVSEPDLLILDEPTNHLDTDTIEWLEQYLSREYGRALLLITHDRYFLDRVVTRTVELAAGVAQSFNGGWTEYLLNKADREALQQRTEANRQNFLRKEVEWLRRQPKARGTKQRARVERAQEALAAAPSQQSGSVRLASDSVRQGSTVLEFKGVRLQIGDTLLVRDFDFAARRGQRIGIIGRNGAGKTSLLRAITAELAPKAGEIVRGKNTRIAYFDQTRSGLDESRTIAENVAEQRDVVQLGEQSLTIYSYLERFLFRAEDIRKKVGMLSGGERARVALAKLLLESSNLLLLDEPTNDLDVTTLGALEDLLCDFGGSVIVVSHDRYFLNRVVTDILAFEGEGVVVHYSGNYDNYLSLRPSLRDRDPATATGGVTTTSPAPAAAGTIASTSASPAPSKKRPPKLTFREEQELQTIEQRITDAEARLAELQAQLVDPELYKKDAARVDVAKRALAEAEAELAQAMARWEELESKREAFESFSS